MALLIASTMSDSGKSMVTAGLSRHFKARPLKFQNMSLNSYSTHDGGEISFIQAYQAIGAGFSPERTNNPILIKPMGKGIEVIFMGNSMGVMTAEEYYSSIDLFWRKIKDSTRKDDLIEGAGGMGEPNFLDKDITVHKAASELGVNIVLVLDIDRGGAFASAYGTYLMSPPSVRDRMKGFIINKFRGDPKYLDPAIKWLEERTSMKYLGTIRYQEDFLMMPEDSMNLNSFGEGEVTVGVMSYPYISNFNEFFALNKSNASVRFVKKRKEIEKSDLVILPGSRNTVESLRWMKERGLDEVVRKKPLIGVCGGFQMMGSVLRDKYGIESGEVGTYSGLGLFDFEVTYVKEKVVSQSSADNGISGYEIRRGVISYGKTEPLYVIEKRNGERVSVYDGAMEGDKLGLSIHGFMFSEGRSLLKALGLKISSGRLEEEVRDQVLFILNTLKDSIDLDKIEEIYKS